MLYIADVEKLEVLPSSVMPVTIDGREFPGVLAYDRVLPPSVRENQTLEAYAEHYYTTVLRKATAYTVIQELHRLADGRAIAFMWSESELSKCQLCVFARWLSNNGYIVKGYVA